MEGAPLASPAGSVSGIDLTLPSMRPKYQELSGNISIERHPKYQELLRSHRCTNVCLYLLIFVCIVAISLAAIGLADIKFPTQRDSSEKATLEQLVTADAIVEHLQVLERSASYSSGPQPTRAAGTEGYNMSADYVFNTVGALGWRVWQQPLDDMMTSNVIAEAPGGDPSNRIVIGAPLDSAPTSPGINDNGSGAMSILEIARQLATLMKETKGRQYSHLPALRFCWWGASKMDLAGSTHYVNHLNATSPTELANVVLYLNFNMIASPNFVRRVYDVKNLPPSLSAKIPKWQLKKVMKSSTMLNRILRERFEDADQYYEMHALDGNSDYEPFLRLGIPVGGLTSGADGIKTAEERHSTGGLARAAYDPCHNQPCDTVDNVNREALEDLAKSAAHIVSRLAATEALRHKLAVSNASIRKLPGA